MSINRMAEGLLLTYWSAKTERPEVTRALYRSVAELDNKLLIEAFASRADAATAVMFGSACDADFADLPTLNLTLLATTFGTVRNVFKRDLAASDTSAMLQQLSLMCVAYLEAVKLPTDCPTRIVSGIQPSQ